MIHESFIQRLGSPETVRKIDTAVLKERYAALLDYFEDSDVLLEYLDHYGEAVFKDGLLSLTNPEDYEALLKNFPKLSSHPILPFARTAMGNFYLIGEIDDETCIAFYNIHTESYLYVNDDFSFFFKRLAGNKPNMEDEAYGLMEFPALEKYGPIGIDECLTFLPALLHGGAETLENIQKVNLKENLEILAKPLTDADVETRRKNGHGMKLLIQDDAKHNLHQTSFGGYPVREVGAPFEWPKCDCGAELQYQGKIKTDIGYEQIFMYNCEDWGDPEILIVGSENIEFVTPEDPIVALRQTETGVQVNEADTNDYESARLQQSANHKSVLGQQNGRPHWIQGDDTPKCDCCNKKMRFVAQLEDDRDSAMNFGGGCGYLFDCKEGKTAKLISQN
ncbi:T6SS immunity protein Tdi1 domain-containing protein [Flavobacterium sp.]|uniref:T6SS immunity protein Tdi1 domain-containing protein n=1 Tax=Flavobacterium sp. TaxID=239 RepID=UPI00120BF29C|nr:T6SS immunity protein Tdi1 domain-containing protein [Flavobacterium sp.]RZJ71750.1 MAG: DUF1851 domain-containing protein [Flavobacterium sp.]